MLPFLGPLVLSVLFAGGLRGQGKAVIWNFNDSLANSLGGNYNVFSRDPSWARTYLDPDVHLPPSGHSLRVTVHRAVQGFCGVWMNFYSPADNPPRYFDARAYRYLTFWIKGEQAGGDFDVKLVDENGERHEDALLTRPIHAYLPRGISPSWQKVWIPLADFPEVEPGSLARLVLIFPLPGDRVFYLDDIGFESLKTPAELPSAMQLAPHAPHQLTDSQNAMWVWRTQDLLNDPDEPGQLFSFCARVGVREIYLSVDFIGPSPDQSPVTVATPDRIRAFLDAAHRHGLRVQALAGSPEWAVTAHHARALATIKSLVDFNNASPLSARFDGIHFDVEPYVLIGFEDLAFRRQLLDGFLEMVAQCSEATKRAGMAFSCDVPWWFFPPAGSPDRRSMTLDFGGEEKTVGEHLLDLLNSVTIMDYRNEADGAGGIINFGTPAIAYAAPRHKTVVVGLETSAEQPSPVDFVLALPAADFNSRLAAAHLLEERTFHGYVLHALAGGGTVFVGLGPPQPEHPAPVEPIEQALSELRREVGAAPNQFLVQPLLQQASAAANVNPEWTDFRQQAFTGVASQTPFVGFQAMNRTAPNITFHGLGRKVFEEEAESVEEWLGREPGFGGLGLHYYTSLRALMEIP